MKTQRHIPDMNMTPWMRKTSNQLFVSTLCSINIKKSCPFVFSLTLQFALQCSAIVIAGLDSRLAYPRPRLKTYKIWACCKADASMVLILKINKEASANLREYTKECCKICEEWYNRTSSVTKMIEQLCWSKLTSRRRDHRLYSSTKLSITT